jgi:hypothetical protein
MVDHAAHPQGTGCGQGWEVIAATARGVHHERAELPSQDSWRRASLPDGGIVLAVADGHGHRRHFRSDRGARMAAAAGCAAVQAAIADLPGAWGSLPADVLRRWREAVDLDLSSDPFTTVEDTWRTPGDEPVLAYGTTLLVAAVSGGWVLLLRIGDGDVLTARPDGSVGDPLPKDPCLTGEQTTSLCQPDALSAFRVAVLDLQAEPLALLLLATDGYGNAQVDDPWQPGVGADLVAMLAEHGPAWVESRLPGWVAACASAEGSGDDTTVGLVVGRS